MPMRSATAVRAGSEVAADQLDTLITVLDLVRSGRARTRPELTRLSGLGRNLVTQRVGQLVGSGLVGEGALGRSTGGRAPRELFFRADAGHLLVAELGATSVGVALADLSGNLTGMREEPADVADGPELVLQRVTELFAELLRGQPDDLPVWGIGMGLPGPVEFRNGRPVAPPIMPGWDGFPVREYLQGRFGVPVWVDNDVNVMALGELRAGLARDACDVVYVKIGTGIGAGVVSGGRLHRGAQGAAGDIGHIAVVHNDSTVCRCGKTGCLEALAGGAALARDGALAVTDPRSTYLTKIATGDRTITALDVARPATYGDPVAVALLRRSATLVGEVLAGLVNFFNPSLILIGGGIARSGDQYLAWVREVVFSRSLPLATRSLHLVHSPLGERAGLMGAAFMVVDELFSLPLLGQWINAGTPVGRLRLAV